MCGVCQQLGLDPSFHESTDPSNFNLDKLYDLGFRTFANKPIFDQPAVIEQIDSGRTMVVGNDGIITYTFAVANHITGLYNNKNYGLPNAGDGYSRLSPEQQAAARESIQLWDDLIAPRFVEQKGLGNADITLANSLNPGQAYAFYPSFDKPGVNYPGDIFIRDPNVDGWSNKWFSELGYGKTTIIHELGHTLGLSHPGAYNGAGATTYAAQAEYAQDSNQYSIMSYWSQSSTGARVVNWNEFVTVANPQTPMLHDILTIQAKYGADPTTRVGDTVYGFNSNAGNWLYDFNQNAFPFLSVYDAGGKDTIDLSGFTVSQFIDLHQGAFSSIGGGAPLAADVNAARIALGELAGFTPTPYTQAQINSIVASFTVGHANAIASDQQYLGMPAVTGIATTEYQNFSIAYGTVIENATGGSARDLIHGNEVNNVLKGLGGNDVIRGFEGNDILVGGAGADVLTGGIGNDRFVFDQLSGDLGNQITDFALGDLIDFGPLNIDLSFIGGSAFSATGQGQLNYVGGVLQGDFDGNGSVDFSVIMSGMPTLTTDSFVGI